MSHLVFVSHSNSSIDWFMLTPPARGEGRVGRNGGAAGLSSTLPMPVADCWVGAGTGVVGRVAMLGEVPSILARIGTNVIGADRERD